MGEGCGMVVAAAAGRTTSLEELEVRGREPVESGMVPWSSLPLRCRGGFEQDERSVKLGGCGGLDRRKRRLK